MYGKMAGSEGGEVDRDNEVNDAPASNEDLPDTKSPIKEKPGFIKLFKEKSFKRVKDIQQTKRSENTGNDQKQILDSPLRSPNSPNSAVPGILGARFGFDTKKPIQEKLETVTEAINIPEEPRPEVTDREKEEVRDTYCLPEIPSVPLSVMEINKLIEMEVLEEAYVNLLSLRLELQQQRQALNKEDLPIELAHKEKDHRLLYETLRDKISNIVRSSSTQPSCNKELLVYVAHIILEEEKRQGESEAMLGWREAWRNAVRDGVRDTLKKVKLDKREQNTSWLAVHLGLLGKAVVEHLKRVKAEFLDSYPPDFDVFETYVSCHHEVVGEHLKNILDRVTEVKDYYAFLDFIIHRYPSEKIMGSSSLQPEMKADWKTLPVDKDFLNQIKSKYCNRLQTDVRTSLDRIIKLENKEMWKNRKQPMIDEGLYSSHIHMDIWTNIEGYVQTSRRIDVNLEQKVALSCLEELKLFPTRFVIKELTTELLLKFESAFIEWSRGLSNSSPWAEYHISYINSFSALKEHMECYKKSCPTLFEQVQKEIDGLTSRLSQTLMKQFKMDVQPFLQRQITRRWFSSDPHFSKLISRTKSLSEQTKYMRPPPKETLVNEAHFFVVKEYVSQLMKNNYSCKNRKNEIAASKITQQWEELQALFKDMNSTLDWLHPVGNQLSIIIGCKKSDIKNNLQPLVKNYPDIRTSHLSAVLYFRGVTRGQEKQTVLQHLMELKQSIGDAENKEHVLFSEIQAAENTGCFAGIPITCLSFINPDD